MHWLWSHCGLCTRNAYAWTSSIQREVSNHIKRTGHCLELWKWHDIPRQELGSRSHCGLCTRNACAWTSSIQREVSSHIKRTGHCLELWTWHDVPGQELGSRNFTMHALLVSMTSLCRGRQPEDPATFSCGPSHGFRISQCEDEVEDRY